jgi:hypothetical protein
MARPQFVDVWQVDQVIEALSFQEGRERELVVGDLYYACRVDPYDEDVPLRRVWSRLQESTRQAIQRAYEREGSWKT